MSIYICVYIYIGIDIVIVPFSLGRSPVRFNSLFSARLDLWRYPGYPRVPSPRRNFPTSTSGTASIQVVGGARSFLGCWVGPLQKKKCLTFF